MGLREELQRKCDRKAQENRDLEQQARELQTCIRENNSYIQALQDTMRMLDKEPATAVIGRTGEAIVRPGSSVANAIEILKKSGKAMHVNEMLKLMGKPITRNTKAALSGTLSPYVKRGQIFTRPAPNTFALVEFGEAGSGAADEPPASFGLDASAA